MTDKIETLGVATRPQAEPPSACRASKAGAESAPAAPVEAAKSAAACCSAEAISVRPAASHGGLPPRTAQVARPEGRAGADAASPQPAKPVMQGAPLWSTYRPVFVIALAALAGGALHAAAHGGSHPFMAGMQMAMGLTLLPLALLKLFDPKGFAASFARYDPIARRLPAYGRVYPYLELGVALLYIAGVFITPAAAATILLLGPTALGIASSLRQGETLDCACVGSRLGLPLGKVSLIENSAMVAMAAIMLAMT